MSFSNLCSVKTATLLNSILVFQAVYCVNFPTQAAVIISTKSNSSSGNLVAYSPNPTSCFVKVNQKNPNSVYTKKRSRRVVPVAKIKGNPIAIKNEPHRNNISTKRILHEPIQKNSSFRPIHGAPLSSEREVVFRMVDDHNKLELDNRSSPSAAGCAILVSIPLALFLILLLMTA